MKYIFMTILLSFHCIYAQHILELPLYKQTDHFMIFCMPVDHAAADDILKEEQIFFEELQSAFNHVYSAKVLLYVYPDITSFHQAIGCPDAPDWVAGYTKPHTRMTVSPRNPGPQHSYEDIMNGNKAGLVMIFIHDKYPSHAAIPRWLHQGVGLYKAGYYSDTHIKKLVQNISTFPTLEQLEAIEKKNDTKFDELNGFFIGFSMVQFIDQTWGWQAILHLLEDYAQFENILHVNKKQFYNKWIDYFTILARPTK